jgi:histone acetyltransferase (RNA polymerase elongator complex component)
MVLDCGFSLVGQMMIGLPLSTLERELYTAKELCKMGVGAVRIYPTVVFYQTQLCKMAQEGLYTPLELEDAIFRTAEVIDIFDIYNIPTIRVGLCASENLSSQEEVFGGANHPAMGELAMNRVFLKRICSILDKTGAVNNKVIRISVPMGARSKVIGQKKRNLAEIYEKYSPSGIIIIEKNELIGYNIEIDIS